MLKYIIIENNDNLVCYRYFPEGREEHGEITVRKADKEIVEQKVAPDDEFKWYFFKMYKRIKDFIDCGAFNETGTIAWY